MDKLNVVFLDIDGVLQPYDAEYCFYSPDKSIIDRMSKQFNTDYSEYSFYDVAAVYYDWDEQAICRLKYILDQTHSKLIVSSDWRCLKKTHKMKDLLKIQGLDSYWLADNVILDKEHYEDLSLIRAKEIRDSLIRYRVNNFVVLDDMKEMQSHFPNNCVITHNIISVNNMHEAIRILKKNIR